MLNCAVRSPFDPRRMCLRPDGHDPAIGHCDHFNESSPNARFWCDPPATDVRARVSMMLEERPIVQISRAIHRAYEVQYSAEFFNQFRAGRTLQQIRLHDTLRGRSS